MDRKGTTVSIETSKLIPKRGATRRWPRRIIAIGAWLVLLLVAAVWGVLQFGDDWWPATLIMFLPRWIWIAPPAVVVIASLILRRRSLLPALIALSLAIGPVMGLCLPWRAWFQPPPTDFTVRILTCNMHYGKTDPRLLDSLIAEVRPDLVALQEWRDSAESEVLSKRDWDVHRDKGLFLASRFPIVEAKRLGPDSNLPQGSAMQYKIFTPHGSLNLISLHLESPREGLGQVVMQGVKGKEQLIANSVRRSEQSAHLAAEAARISGPMLVVGDFNTPPESVLFRRVWGRYYDAFETAGLGWGYTFENRRTSVRIDHILVDRSGNVRRSWVGANVGSPHRPVIADVSWPENN